MTDFWFEITLCICFDLYIQQFSIFNNIPFSSSWGSFSGSLFDGGGGGGTSKSEEEVISAAEADKPVSMQPKSRDAVTSKPVNQSEEVKIPGSQSQSSLMQEEKISEDELLACENESDLK